MSLTSAISQRIKSSGGYFFDQALVSGGNFALTIALGRLMGPEQFGLFSLGWMGVLFGSSLQQAFVLTPMLSLFGQQKLAKGSVYLGTLATLQLGMALLPLLICLIALPIWTGAESIRAMAWPVAFASLGHQLYDFSRKSLLVRKQLGPVQAFDAAVLGLQLVGALALWLQGLLSPAHALWLLAFAYLLPSLIPFFKQVSKGQTALLHALVKLHWGYGKWLGASALLQWFSGNFFILAGGAMLGVTAMGAIRMAQTVTGILNLLLLAMDNFIPVRAAHILATEGPAALGRYLYQVGWKSMLVFIPMILLLAVAAPWIIDLAFGEAYLPYVGVLQGFALYYLLVVAGTILRYHYRSTGLTREIFFAYVLSAAAGLVLAQPMVRHWGWQGILAGLAISQALILGWLFFRIPPHSNPST